MNSSDQAIQELDWRKRVRNMRTIAGLRASTPATGAVERLTDRDLAAAAENPDHSEAGRAAARAELQARGLEPRSWRLKIPGFINAADLDLGPRLFFGAGQALRVWSGRGIFLILLGVLIAAALAPDRERLTLESRFWIEIIGWRIDSDTLFASLGLFSLSIAGIWLLASALRRKPARVLLLRKFNVRALASPLEKMMAEELRPYGHIVSLSDKHIKRDNFGWLSTALLSLSNPLAAIWFIVGAPLRFIWRLFDRSRMGPASVTSARDYRHLAGRLRDRIGLNVQVALASKEAFLVRTSDSWWRMVIRLLMDSTDAIIVDLSQVSEGTAWELDLIRDENAAARCVFVALWGKGEDAEAALARWGFADACHFYAPDGHMLGRARFRAAMLNAMRAAHAG